VVAGIERGKSLGLERTQHRLGENRQRDGQQCDDTEHPRMVTKPLWRCAFLLPTGGRAEATG
jgi:hypothetical protein